VGLVGLWCCLFGVCVLWVVVCGCVGDWVFDRGVFVLSWRVDWSFILGVCGWLEFDGGGMCWVVCDGVFLLWCCGLWRVSWFCWVVCGFAC